MSELHPDIEKVLLTEQDIKDITRRLGAEITADYADKNPLLVAVLRGAVVFMADLMRSVTCPIAIDFMATSSYGSGVTSSGTVRILKDLETNIRDRHVIIAEDILDSGLTLSNLIGMLNARGPASIEICAFAVKDIDGYTPPVTPKYVGCHVPNEFIVGYGLDYAERYRNLPYVGVLKSEVYS